MRGVLLACALLLSTDALADAQAGERKAQLCLLCHKPQNVIGLAPLLEAQPSKYLVQATTEYKTGKRPDPLMKSNVTDLSARDIGDIADYFASRAPMVGVWSTDPAKVAAGEKRVARGKCASCHGPTFAGKDEVPRLAGQKPVYLRILLEAFAAGRRAHPPIEIPFDRIGDFDAIAHYFAAAR
jgi:cytochrome c553